MAHRTAKFLVHRDPSTIQSLGYIPEIAAVCTLNDFIQVFTVRRLPRVFGKDEWQLAVTLPAVVTSRPYGMSIYKTFDEALAHGVDFVRQYFPLIEDTPLTPDPDEDTIEPMKEATHA